MTAERDLATLLRSAEPVVAHREVVLVAAPPERVGSLPALAMVVEEEGVTAVLRRADAEALCLPFDWVGTWITLRVHSALDAVGLTAAASGALAAAGISCNVLAGLHHDHLLVPTTRADDALALLRRLGG